MKSNYLDVLLSYNEIINKIRLYAKELVKVLEKDESTILVNVLNGSTPFFVDLVREINKLGYNKKLNIEYISASSYVNVKSETLKINKWVEQNVKNKVVYVFEDVIDTGKTLAQITKRFYEVDGVKQVNIVTLVDKFEAHPDSKLEYKALFKLKNVFLVGYGLDCDEKFRQLRDVCIYKV